MTVQELLDKLQEIKDITLDLPKQETDIDNERVSQIQRICDDAILRHRIEKKLREIEELTQNVSTS